MENSGLAEDRLLQSQVVADRLDIHVDTLKRWRGRGWGPRFITLDGGQIRYQESEVARYLNMRTSPSAAATA